MTQIIIFIIVIAIVFFTRKIWSKYLILIFAKKKGLAVSNKQDGSVFQPSGTKRMFAIAIEIEELGDGTAKISLAKLKDKEI